MSRAARLPPWALAAVLAAAVLALNPRTADLAAQTYRVALFQRAGYVLWDNGWYAGHHVPAYSLLFPPLGALVGVRLTGALAVVAATAAFGALVAGTATPRTAQLAGAWFALGATAMLVSNRLTFLVGVAFGLAALAAVRHRRERLGALLALATAASSPVAGLFVALAAAGWWLGDRAARRAGVAALAVLAVLPALVAGALFPEGGTFPFALSSFLPALAISVAVAAVLPPQARVLRAGALLYVALVVLSGVVPSPMGGNAVRLGALAAGPVLLLAGAARPGAPRWGLALLGAGILAWQVVPAQDDWRQTAHDPTITSAAYASLKRFLAVQGGPPARVEVAFTDNHWEAAKLPSGALRFPLARGWERQYDRRVNALFYDGRRLTAARYHAWLTANAVRWVVLADAPVDYSAAGEAALVRRGLPFLQPVYRDRTWRVWAVRDARPIGVRRLVDDGFDAGAGARTVRIRWSPWFAVTAGRGCVSRAGAWTRVQAAGPVAVRARLSWHGLLRRARSCRG